uniref:Uncharacterized protein n=1 Tax=Chromera velia CCMP2878 TaxID=1169474 RepID=A0A0G4IDW3_9ALVE|eukprot:Cvel_13427.t1-p1 / transcript=Cvel_13427.t1 / gene=Cvel_13427 / organism=Chromera_velia_CCMP2878 / gene_product=hypothetical protein / transcript_product=hypothetical protein / location=Cvel_scaffold916:15171-18674(+) / protein_length=592 / sequence_SO=supercontig / SO=protein_coding / is_pseudo=false
MFQSLTRAQVAVPPRTGEPLKAGSLKFSEIDSHLLTFSILPPQPHDRTGSFPSVSEETDRRLFESAELRKNCDGFDVVAVRLGPEKEAVDTCTGTSRDETGVSMLFLGAVSSEARGGLERKHTRGEVDKKVADKNKDQSPGVEVDQTGFDAFRNVAVRLAFAAAAREERELHALFVGFEELDLFRSPPSKEKKGSHVHTRKEKDLSIKERSGTQAQTEEWQRGGTAASIPKAQRRTRRSRFLESWFAFFFWSRGVTLQNAGSLSFSDGGDHSSFKVFRPDAEMLKKQEDGPAKQQIISRAETSAGRSGTLAEEEADKMVEHEPFAGSGKREKTSLDNEKGLVWCCVSWKSCCVPDGGPLAGPSSACVFSSKPPLSPPPLNRKSPAAGPFLTPTTDLSPSPSTPSDLGPSPLAGFPFSFSSIEEASETQELKRIMDREVSRRRSRLNLPDILGPSASKETETQADGVKVSLPTQIRRSSEDITKSREALFSIYTPTAAKHLESLGAEVRLPSSAQAAIDPFVSAQVDCQEVLSCADDQSHPTSGTGPLIVDPNAPPPRPKILIGRGISSPSSALTAGPPKVFQVPRKEKDVKD